MFSTYLRLRVPVWATPLQVIRAARKRLNPKALRDPAMREHRRAFYCLMLGYHHAGRETVDRYHL